MLSLNQVFIEAFETAKEHNDILFLKHSNRINNHPTMKSTCTTFCIIMERELKSNPTFVKEYDCQQVQGKWTGNLQGRSRDFADCERRHTWLLIRNKTTEESIEFDYTYGQFLDKDISFEEAFAVLTDVRSKGETLAQEYERLKNDTGY